MTPERRARQAQIMRERWATRRPAMAAILAQAQAARAAAGHRGLRAYHAQAGHDGGRSAALADGAHDSPYHAVLSLDYWEAVHEPPWDIGWGDRGPATPPPQLPADAVLEPHHAAPRYGWHWAGWVIRRPTDPPDLSLAEAEAGRHAPRPQPARSPVSYACAGCGGLVSVTRPVCPPGFYAVRCPRCATAVPLEGG